MPCRLSTLLLISFIVLIPLAMLGAWGLWISSVILITALCLNHSESLKSGLKLALVIIAIGGICFILFLPVRSTPHEPSRPAVCANNLKQIGLVLHNYHDAYKHFPPVNICDKDGKPLFSWRVAILPMIEYGILYEALKKDEPWNGPHNAKILSQALPEYQCPSANREKNDFTTNYIAVIGPGTAWREDGPVKRSDLPDGGSHTVMAVEVVDSGVHWAEPRDLTVEDALERMKTRQGLRISTAHPSAINILFADGTVRSLPAIMPISLWKKLLAGEVADVDKIEDSIDQSAPDMVNVSVNIPPYEPGKWTIIIGGIVWLLSVIIGGIVWLLSVALLFYRAIKSRRKAGAAT